jgi:hypothetical protein
MVMKDGEVEKLARGKYCLPGSLPSQEIDDFDCSVTDGSSGEGKVSEVGIVESKVIA